MSIDRLFRPLVAVYVTDGPADEYGNPTETTTRATVYGHVAQSRAYEDNDGRRVVVEESLAYLKAGTALSGLDRLEVDGEAFDVDGPPWRVRNPRTGRESHLEARVRRAE